MKTRGYGGLTFADAIRQLGAVLRASKHEIVFFEDQFQLWYGEELLVYSDNEHDIVAKLFQILGVEPDNNNVTDSR